MEYKLLVSEDLKELLKEIESDSIVASLLLKEEFTISELANDPVNYISISTQDRTKISYLTGDRIKSLDPSIYWTSSRRFHAKPGGFISKLFKNISSKEIEKFSNLYRSQALKPVFNLNVVNGESIRKYYHHQSYSSGNGTLGASCMKHEGCQQFLDIYTENQEVVSMLAMTDNDGRLMGRALLWDFDSYKIMDRIYTTCDENLAFYFKQWGTKNGYSFKSEQNWYNTLFFEQVGGKRQEMQLSIQLKESQFRYYPYVDTFKFIDMNTGLLSNFIPKTGDIRTLCGSDGSKYGSDYLVLDIFDKMFRHRGDCNYLDYLNEYSSSSNIYWSEINDQYILRTDAIFDNEINDYIFNEEQSKFNNTERIEKRRSDIEERQKKNSVPKSNPGRYSSILNTMENLLGSDNNLDSLDISSIERILGSVRTDSYRSHQQYYGSSPEVDEGEIAIESDNSQTITSSVINIIIDDDFT